MIRFERCLGFGVAALALAGLGAGCGGGDSSGGGGSFASIQSSIASPTGTVDETTAADVGAQFEKVSSSGMAMGMRRDAQVAQSGSQTLECEAGGSMSSSGSGNESSGQVTASYDNCCMIEDCCTDGIAKIYFSSDQTASYTFCGSYDFSYSCEGTTADLKFNGCFGSSGEWVYVVEVDGESYAVSGAYANGSGELEITGANGTWTCTYTNAGGTCTGTSGNFEF
jgi:hypothetical protein